MRNLIAAASLCACMFQIQANLHASDRDDLYETILAAPQKNDQSPLKKTRSKNGEKNLIPYQATGGLKAMVAQIAHQNGVPANIAHGVVMAESRYNCTAYNRSGASGIMQVLPSTARSVGVHGSLRSCSNGLQAGMKYLKLALNRGGYGCSGVSLYQKGVYARPLCTAYGRKVMAYAQGV